MKKSPTHAGVYTATAGGEVRSFGTLCGLTAAAQASAKGSEITCIACRRSRAFSATAYPG